MWLLGWTAFLLGKRLLTRRLDAVTRYLDWTAEKGARLRGVEQYWRVFSEVPEWTGPPGKGVEAGFKAADFPDYDEQMGKLFELVKPYGRLEFVACTAREHGQAHAQRMDRLAAPHAHALFEVANEPPVNQIDLDRILAGWIPTTPIWASGQYDPTPYPAGVYMNDHPPRDDEFARKFKGAVELASGDGPYEPFSPPYHGPVMLDEPKRIDEGGSDDDWRAFGAGARLFAAGATIHGGPWAQRCDPGLLDAAAVSRIDAFLDGIAAVPPQRYHGYGHPDDAGSLRRYTRRGDDGKTYEVSVRPYGFRQV